MKPCSWLAVAAVALYALPAIALEITNLDKVDHRILFQSAGGNQVYTIGSGQTRYIAGQPNGFISLLTVEQPKPSQGTVQSDGILSGIIGNGRTEGIPAESRAVFAIWPGGKIGVQRYRRYGRGNG